MSWPFVSGATAKGTTTSLSVTKSVTAGDFLVVFYCCVLSGGFTPTISDNGSTPNSWAPVRASNIADSSPMIVWSCIARVTGSITVTIAAPGGAGSSNQVAFGEWIPPALAVIEEASAKASNVAGSTTADAELTGSVTTLADGDLVLSFILDVTAFVTSTEYAAGTSPNAFTKRTTLSNDPGGASDGTFAVEEFVQTIHGAINPTWTAANTNNYSGITVAFKARPAGCTGHIQGAGVLASPGASSVTTTLPVLPAPGNAVLCGVEFFAGSSPATITAAQDENGNNYTVTPNSPSPLSSALSGQTFMLYLLKAPANAGKSITVTFSIPSTTNGPALWVDEFSYQGLAAFDADYTGTGTGTALNTPASVGNFADELLHSASSFEHTVNAVNTPWLISDGGFLVGEAAGYIASSSAPGIAFSMGGTPSGNWSTMAQAIKFVAVDDVILMGQAML